MSEPLRVLCVDDDPDVLELTRTYLRRELSAGEVVTAGGASAALATLDDERVDCVVSDYDMPERNGLELLRAVRERDPDIPFVLFTGKGSEEIASEAISAGVTDYIQKAGPEKFELLANRVEDAVDQRRAERDLERTRRTLEQLHGSGLRLRQVDSPQAAYEEALEAAVEVLEFDVCGFFEVEDGVFVPQAASSYHTYEQEVGPDEGLVGRTYRTGEPSLVNDVADHDDALDPTDGETGADGQDGMESALTVPVGDHGVFQAVARDRELFDEADLELAELLVAHLAAALDRLGYAGDARSARRKVEQLHETALALREADDREAVFERTVDAAGEVLSFDVCGLFVLDDDRFQPVALHDFDPDYERLDRGEGIIGRTFESGTSVLVDDVAAEPDAEPRDESFRSVLSVPVGDHGVFQAVSSEAGAFDERDLELAELLVAHAGGALDRLDYEADLKATNEHLEAVLQNTTANIYIKDLEGRYVLVNEAFADSLGVDREAVVGRTDEALQPDAVAEEVRANDRRALAEGQPIEVEESARWGGTERTYYSVKAPLFDDDGDAWAVCGVSSDVTGMKARQEELERKTERLEAFASVASHDLRNPLSVAQGYADLLADDGHDAAVEVSESLDRMEEILDDLLALASEGRTVGDTRPVDLATAAEHAWGNVPTGEATLQVGATTTLEADRSRLVEALENLFRNAVEHGSTSPQQAGEAADNGGADAVTVRVEVTDEGFAVADDGCGLPEEDVLVAGVSTAAQGTGVGLAIVSRIAEAHGWTLDAVDGEEGARFEFAV